MIGKSTFLQKHAEDNNNCKTPAVVVKIADTEWKKTVDVDITDVEVSSDVWGTAGICNIEFTMFNATEALKDSEVKMPDEFSSIKIGVKFEVSLGYVKKSALGVSENKVEVVFKGYISKIDYCIEKNTIAVRVQAMDGLMWIMANRKTELKKDKKKYSAVITEMLGKYSSLLSDKSVDIKGEMEYETPIYQSDQSDFDFIKEVCEKFGCLFFISNGKCFISKIADINNESKITLDYDGNHIYSMSTSIDIFGIPKKIEVIGTDPKDYTKQIKSETAKVSSAVGSKGKEANEISSNITANNIITVIDEDVASADEAKVLAEAILNLKVVKSLVTKIKMIGYPKVVLGQKVTLKKFGDPIDNDYIVAGIKHEISKESESGPYEYCTTVTLNSDKIEAQKKSQNKI